MGNVRDNINMGTLKVTADAIEQMFGSDDLDFGDVDYGDADLFGDDDDDYGDDDDDDDDDDIEENSCKCSHTSRRKMAEVARSQIDEAEYGLLGRRRRASNPLKKGLFQQAEVIAAAREMAKGMTEAAIAPVSAPIAAAPALLTPIVPKVPVPASPVLSVPSLAPTVASTQVEATKETLPPVYVADRKGFDSDISLIEGRKAALKGAKANLQVEESFGSTALLGMVGSQARKSGQHAAYFATKCGAKSLASSRRVPDGEPFVEDPHAEPVLFGDGRISDSAYGDMTAIPCPSCSRVSKKAAFSGTGSSCVVCDDYGAIIVPSSDVPSWSGGVQYGLIPLLIPLIGAGISAASPAATEAGKGWLKGKKAAKIADLASREEAILARLNKKVPESKPVATKEEASESENEIPKVVPSATVSGLFGFDVEDLDIYGDDEDGDEDLDFDDEDIDVDDDFDVDDEEVDDLLDDDDDDGGEAFGAELASRVDCVRALVPSSYLRASRRGRVN